MRAVGFNPHAAQRYGINVARGILIVMLVSGGLAGWAGAAETLGLHARLIDNFSPGYGWTAIAVALLARNHPLRAIIAAIFLGGLYSGAGDMQRATGAPITVIQVIIGLVIISVIAAPGLHYLRKPKKVLTGG